MTAALASQSSMPRAEQRVGRRVLTSTMTLDASNPKQREVSQSAQAWSTVGRAIWDLHRHTALEKELVLLPWQMQSPSCLVPFGEKTSMHSSCTRDKNLKAVSLGLHAYSFTDTRTAASQTDLGIVEQLWVQHAGAGSVLFNTKQVLQHRAGWRMLWSRAQQSVSMSCGAQRMASCV